MSLADNAQRSGVIKWEDVLGFRNTADDQTPEMGN